jgi:hypothetical protein
VRATPKVRDEMCEHTACTLGEIVAWEITGDKATRRVLLDGKAHTERLDRVQPVWGRDDTHVAVVVSGYPTRYLLRWRWGDAKATFGPLPAGTPDEPDAMRTILTSTGDVIDMWLTRDRGLEIRRIPVNPKAKGTTLTLAPLPKRTPRDRPLFHVIETLERENGDLLVVWGEYLLNVPPSGPARRLDLRSVFGRKVEFSGRVLYVPSPEGVWIGIESGRNTDFTFLPQADLDARMTPAP